jgi:hypothetical protein
LGNLLVSSSEYSDNKGNLTVTKIELKHEKYFEYAWHVISTHFLMFATMNEATGMIKIRR